MCGGVIVSKKKCVIVVDNSNIFIEGQKYSATAKARQDQMGTVCDPSWRIDFGKLLFQLANGREIHGAILVGSRPPANDSVWNEAKKLGFIVTVHERDFKGKEKAVDTELVAQGTEIIVDAQEPMTLVIASGDRDFIPLVSVAHRRKWQVEMAAFSSAFSTTGQMATSVDDIRPLEAIFKDIGYNAFDWPI
jgi:uncharacterized LabA/DUF88 family protein